MARLSVLVPFVASAALLTACPETIRVGLDDAGEVTRDTGTTSTTDTGTIGEVDSGMTGETDSGTSTETDAGTMGADASTPDSGPASCIVDPFLRCDDPDEATRTNNEWADATYYNGNHTVGCLTGDNLTPLLQTTTSVVCPSEPADWYQITLVGCDTRTMFAEIRLHPTEPCDAANWDLLLQGEGQNPCMSADGHVTCMMDGADRVIRVRVEPRSVVFGWYFGVVTMGTNVKFSYALSVDLH